MSSNAYFDAQAFLKAIDRVREERNVSWYQIKKEIGLNLSDIRRVRESTSKGFSANTIAGLVLWSKLDPRPFMKRYSEAAL